MSDPMAAKWAVERLQEINPHVEVVPHAGRLEASNALEIVSRYDIVADGTDNFATRYLVNDACVLTGRPDVYGAIFRFEGQMAVFRGEDGPCYRCLFPEPPPPDSVPNCAEGGVLGVLPGIVGALQANEVIKLALGVGEPAVGRLILFDGLQLQFRQLKLPKNPLCPICSENPVQTGLIDYEEFCGTSAVPPHDEVADVEPAQVARWLAEGRGVTLLDVREGYEYAIGHLEGAILLPLNQLVEHYGELSAETEYVVYCHHGIRSAQAGKFLQRRGYGRVWNLAGGIDAWSRLIDPSIPRY
jgi:adenylyltransferase/sulfurtransferase